MNIDIQIPDETVAKFVEALVGRENPPSEIHLELVDLTGKIAVKVVPSRRE